MVFKVGSLTQRQQEQSEKCKSRAHCGPAESATLGAGSSLCSNKSSGWFCCCSNSRAPDAGRELPSSCHTATLPTPGGLNSTGTTGSPLSLPPCHRALGTAGLPSPQPCRWSQAPVFTDLLPHLLALPSHTDNPDFPIPAAPPASDHLSHCASLGGSLLVCRFRTLSSSLGCSCVRPQGTL